ncbi:MAG: gliding motility protein GldL [Flavobacteriales bacterium]|nr:gliding motility protein GldL [Flavobacteriales bacterium]
MTARGAIVLLLLGLGIGIIGNLFKIQHWPNTGAILISASSIQAVAVFILALKVSRYPGFKDFLDR